MFMLELAFGTAVVCCLLLRGKPGIDDDVRQLELATIPPGATPIQSAPGHTSTWVVERSWTFDASAQWDDYCRWLARLLPVGFKIDPAATQPAYVRSLAGDAQRITFQKQPGASRLRVRVTFVDDAD